MKPYYAEQPLWYVDSWTDPVHPRVVEMAPAMSEPNRFQRDIDHWNETGKCLRHFSIDTPPRFCEQCGKDWKAVVDGREGRKRRRDNAA